MTIKMYIITIFYIPNPITYNYIYNFVRRLYNYKYKYN